MGRFHVASIIDARTRGRRTERVTRYTFRHGRSAFGKKWLTRSSTATSATSTTASCRPGARRGPSPGCRGSEGVDPRLDALHLGGQEPGVAVDVGEQAGALGHGQQVHGLGAGFAPRAQRLELGHQPLQQLGEELSRLGALLPLALAQLRIEGAHGAAVADDVLRLVEEHLGEALEARLGLRVGARPLGEQGAEMVHALLDDRLQQVVLALEVVVEVALGDARGGRHVGEGGAVEPPLVEELVGGGEDSFAVAVGFRLIHGGRHGWAPPIIAGWTRRPSRRGRQAAAGAWPWGRFRAGPSPPSGSGWPRAS